MNKLYDAGKLVRISIDADDLIKIVRQEERNEKEDKIGMVGKAIKQGRPKRSDNKYWVGTSKFNEIDYFDDLEEYVSDLEIKIWELEELFKRKNKK